MCYKLNPETKLYRADTERLQNGVNHGIATDYLPNEGPVFFGFAESSVDQYGIVAEYEVLHPIQSIALDDPVTLNKLHDNCVIEDIKKILRENYGAGKPSAVRKSVKPNDFKLINYLIDTYGMGGTVFLASVYSEGGSFHPEIALPQREVQPEFLQINQIVTDPTKIPGEITKYNDRLTVPTKNSERLTLTLDSSPISSYSSLFASPMASPMVFHNTHTPNAHDSPMASYASPEAYHSTPDENMSPNVFNGLYESSPYSKASPPHKTSSRTMTKASLSNSPRTPVVKPKKWSYGGSLRKSSKKTKSKKAKHAKKSQRRRRR
jgi:hypothetical protein